MIPEVLGLDWLTPIYVYVGFGTVAVLWIAESVVSRVKRKAALARAEGEEVN